MRKIKGRKLKGAKIVEGARFKRERYNEILAKIKGTKIKGDENLRER